MPRSSIQHPVAWSLAGTAGLGALGLGVRRVAADRHIQAIERRLFDVEGPLSLFSEADLDGLPDPAQRYLRHAIAPATPLAPAVRIGMSGTIPPRPGGPRTALTATETLAPRRGFVWIARARMNGLPARIVDHYDRNEGRVDVVLAGALPVPTPHGPDVTRSARGRLVAEAVWCPTALVGPGVRWEAIDADRARYTITVDGAPVSVTVQVETDGSLREVTLDRWGDVDGQPWRAIPYGFSVNAEGTFGGVTIPTHLTGGWHYGTDRFDSAAAASFTVRYASFAGVAPEASS